MKCYVLTGGESRRMGAPKQNLIMRGRTFLQSAVDIASDAFDEVVIVNRTGAEEIPGIRVVRDQGEGDAAAIFGVKAALEDSDELRLWILAVDYPAMTSEVLTRLRERFESSFAEMFVPVWRGKPQLLCAGWTRTLQRSVARAARDGNYELRSFLDQGRTERIEADGMFEGSPFLNVNTPEDLAELRRLRGDSRGAGEAELSHVAEDGSVRMVDVGDKDVTVREAEAEAVVRLGSRAFEAVISRALPKGDVITTARLAGIMATKRTSELIPMTHPLMIDGVDVSIEPDEENESLVIRARVRCSGRTGVEMEALTACSVAALTVVDMCKSAEKGIVIERIRLMRKSGGRSGTWVRETGGE